MPPAKTMQLEDLAVLRTRINEEHEAGGAASWQGVEHYRACGKALVQVKTQLGHGKWEPWLREHCPAVGERQARRYMRLAKTDVKTSDLFEAWKIICGNGPRSEPQAEDAQEGAAEDGQGSGRDRPRPNGRPSAAHVQRYPVDLQRRQYGRFKNMVGFLAKKWGQENKAEVVFEAVRRSYKEVGGD